MKLFTPFSIPKPEMNELCRIQKAAKKKTIKHFQTFLDILANTMKSPSFYLSFFSRRPLEMSLFFIYCGALACFVSSIGHY